MAALLELKNVRAAYGPIEALHEITLSVDRGEIVTVIGSNGKNFSASRRMSWSSSAFANRQKDARSFRG